MYQFFVATDCGEYRMNSTTAEPTAETLAHDNYGLIKAADIQVINWWMPIFTTTTHTGI